MSVKTPSSGNLSGESPLRVRKACEFCRGRRIKCQMNPGSTSCNACLSRNRTCVLESTSSKDAAGDLSLGDLNALGPLALMRHSFMHGSMSSTQLASNVEKMTSELKVYKDMAQYYQTQMARLNQGLPPTPSPNAAFPSFPTPSMPLSTPSLPAPMHFQAPTPVEAVETCDSRAKTAVEGFRCSSDGAELIMPDGRTIVTRELMIRCHREYYESLSVLFCGEYAIPLTGSVNSMTEKFAMLCQPLIFQDKRAPEDCHEDSKTTGISSIITGEDTPLDTLLELWEHAMVFVGGASSLVPHDTSHPNPSSPSSSSNTTSPGVSTPQGQLSTGSSFYTSPAVLVPIITVLSRNCEKLMRVIVFQREAHTKERLAARLVRALIGMSIHYRQLHKLGAASSLLMIAHQVIATFPAVIPPVLSDRIYVLLLLGSTTEHERAEWLHMLNDQIHFTTATLLSFNAGFLVSKLRTNPVITPAVVKEITEHLKELEALLPTLTVEVPIFQVWVKILVACFHGELGARIGDMQRASLSIVRVEQLVREHYSASLAIILLAELKNFAHSCSPCSVLINGQERVLCHYVIERVQALHDELSAVADDSAPLPPPPYAEVTVRPIQYGAISPRQRMSGEPRADAGDRSSTPRSAIVPDMPPVATPSTSEIVIPAQQLAPSTNDAFLEQHQQQEEDALLSSWSSTGNRLNTELFGFSGMSDDTDMSFI